MKRIISLILITATLVATLTGCGNMSLSLGNFTFTKIHVDTHHYNGCFTVIKWYDNSSGIEVFTKEAGSMYLAEGMYMLISGTCPFCEAEIK
jgi:hypothetical protein